MNVCVFDTETITTEKPFCYNIGYCIFDTDTLQVFVAEDFVVEQIWHNKPLFETAYYAEKKDIYIRRMKGRSTKMAKFGWITQYMAKQFEMFNVQYAYAFNSPFDARVFEFNCDWFKCINPFDNIKILDIRGLVHQFVAFSTAYKNFCEKYNRYTESGNYSTTAETVYQYVTKETTFEEEHTALADSMIEAKILQHCISLGGEYGKEYKVYNSVPNKNNKIFSIEKDKKIIFETSYQKVKIEKNPNNLNIILSNYGGK